jgi:RNA polymerase sigma factor for flagellar operon FliA
MLERGECEALFLANLQWTRRMIAGVCRRYRLAAADAEDFTSWVTLRLVEHDYAVFRQFRGDSSLHTYLTVVVTMLHREYLVRSWGRWRPSAAARRAGGDAVRLEMLVHRDGCTLREAAQVLQARGTCASERELARVLAALPRRRRPWRAELVGAVPSDAADSAAADELVAAAEVADERAAVEAALGRGLDALSAEDRQMVWLRFWEGLTLAEIARRLGVPQKPLYRRMERALVRLRRALEAAGVSAPPAPGLWDRVAA